MPKVVRSLFPGMSIPAMNGHDLDREHAEVAITVGAETLPALAAHDDRRPNPYWAYLDTLDRRESRRTMKGCLDRIARLMADQDPAGIDPATKKKDNAVLAITGETIMWHLLRAEHTQRIRALIGQATSLKKDGTREPWSIAYRTSTWWRCARSSTGHGCSAS